MDNENLRITIPAKLYMASRNTTDSMPLATIIEYSENSNGKNRQKSLDRWAGIGTKDSIDSTIIDNIPLTGFRISRSLRRIGWQGSNTFIRIEDPRGFEIDITAQNMVMLTDGCTLQNGDILEDCVWGRDRGLTVLLPVNSKPYMEAKENTRRNNLKVSLRQVNIGDTVRTDKNLVGVYMGLLYSLSTPNSTYGYTLKPDKTIKQFDISPKKYHVIKQIVNGKTLVTGLNTFKVSEVLEKSTVVKTTSDSDVELLALENAEFTWNNRVWKSNCVGFVSGEVKIQKVERIPYPLDEITNCLKVAAIKDMAATPSVFHENNMGVIYEFNIQNFLPPKLNTSFVAYGKYINDKNFSGAEVDRAYLSHGQVKWVITNDVYNTIRFDNTQPPPFFKILVTMQLAKNGVVFTKYI